MTTFELGQAITWGVVITNSAGVEENAGAVTSTVTLPDGTVAPSSPITCTNTAAGRYAGTLTSTQAGRYRIASTATGANAGGPYTDVVDVWPADPRFIISLADARAALNLPAGARVNDDEIRLYIAAATELVEDRIGAVLRASVVESRSGSGQYGIPLYNVPTGITTVVEDGVTLAATAYAFDEAGMLWRGSRPGAGSWSMNAPRNVVVTYTVGGSSVAPNIVLAAREVVRIMYQRGQQGQHPTFGDAGGPPPVIYSGWGRLDELLAGSDRRVPGFA